MKPLPVLLTGIFAIYFNFASFAQYDFIVPEYKLEAKEDYAKYEQELIKAANWLEATPVGKETDKRILVSQFVFKWVSGSPTVNVPLTPFVQKLSDKNPQFMMMYLAAYARYALENNNDKDELKSSTAAVKSVINLYNLGGAVKKSKFLQKAIEGEKAGNLENWVKENYKAK